MKLFLWCLAGAAVVGAEVAHASTDCSGMREVYDCTDESISVDYCDSYCETQTRLPGVGCTKACEGSSVMSTCITGDACG